MLIQFTVENFRSIREAQTLSLVASASLKRLRDQNTFVPEAQGHQLPRLLRCAAIFGPNAAGKSNLINAIRFVEELVRFSAQANPERPIAVQPYRLSSAPEEDSSFEFEFIEGGIRFQFGLSTNQERITSEWMISYNSTRPTELYRRRYDVKEKQDTYVFGRGLEGGRLRRDWAAQTGPKTLYLSRVVQASNEDFRQLRVPYQWFSKRLRISPPQSLSNNHHTSRVCENDEGKQKVLAFLKAFDIPISDIRIRKRKLDVPAGTFTAELLRQLEIQDGIPVSEPIFTHIAGDGTNVEFETTDESQGTLNLFAFAAKWIEVVENNCVLFVDELDSSLHPLAVWELIRRLGDSKSRAQLIFTTHDVSILRSKLLRRDQTFFISPNKHRESRLYSLLDFKGREEDSFEDRYLQGRYGATPVIAR